jgi:predicted solute-binding protein
MEELKKQAMDLIKKYPNNINADLFKRHLHIGIIKANQILESLENEGFINIIYKNKSL